MRFRWLKSPFVMPKSDNSLGNNLQAIRVPGDGRCLFRSVVHGVCLRAGKPSPSENHERELADELRAAVADEFIKRRADTEWFVEGDFDTYVGKMKQPHAWGGEPELLMSSHVLQLPITVHMWDKKKNCLKIIAEYGQEYGKENPIRVLYHGYGHYDALQSPSDGTRDGETILVKRHASNTQLIEPSPRVCLHWKKEKKQDLQEEWKIITPSLLKFPVAR